MGGWADPDDLDFSSMRKKPVPEPREKEEVSCFCETTNLSLDGRSLSRCICRCKKCASGNCPKKKGD